MGSATLCLFLTVLSKQPHAAHHARKLQRTQLPGRGCDGTFSGPCSFPPPPIFSAFSTHNIQAPLPPFSIPAHSAFFSKPSPPPPPTLFTYFSNPFTRHLKPYPPLRSTLIRPSINRSALLPGFSSSTTRAVRNQPPHCLFHKTEVGR